MLKHLLFFAASLITLYFPPYTYFRQFLGQITTLTVHNPQTSKTRNGRVHIFHSTLMLKIPPRIGQLWFLGASKVQKTGRNIITVQASAENEKSAHGYVSFAVDALGQELEYKSVCGEAWRLAYGVPRNTYMHQLSPEQHFWKVKWKLPDSQNVTFAKAMSES